MSEDVVLCDSVQNDTLLPPNLSRPDPRLASVPRLISPGKVVRTGRRATPSEPGARRECARNGHQKHILSEISIFPRKYQHLQHRRDQGEADMKETSVFETEKLLINQRVTKPGSKTTYFRGFENFSSPRLDRASRKAAERNIQM